jgi:hypothetical protein
MTTPSGRNAWKQSEEIRRWYEVTFDTVPDESTHSGYVCKCCWEQFEAHTSPISLLGHATLHERRGERPYSRRRPASITGEQIVELHKSLVEAFQVVMPDAGTWKFECRRCKRKLPHRSTHRELLQHAAICSGATGDSSRIAAERSPQLTNPSYISAEMFDKVLEERFLNNPDEDGFRQQAMTLALIFRASKSRPQVIVDILHAARSSGHDSKEDMAEIAFTMGLQFGFELGLSYPPLT